jgi:hypothetical protein
MAVGGAQHVDRQQHQSSKHDRLQKAAVTDPRRPVAIFRCHAEMQHEEEQQQAVHDINEVEFVLRTGIGEGLRPPARGRGCNLAPAWAPSAWAGRVSSRKRGLPARAAL